VRPNSAYADPDAWLMTAVFKTARKKRLGLKKQITGSSMLFRYWS
jgi:hypothetical protein